MFPNDQFNAQSSALTTIINRITIYDELTREHKTTLAPDKTATAAAPPGLRCSASPSAYSAEAAKGRASEAEASSTFIEAEAASTFLEADAAPPTDSWAEAADPGGRNR